MDPYRLDGNSVTNDVVAMLNIFKGCYSLDKVNFSGFRIIGSHASLNTVSYMSEDGYVCHSSRSYIEHG